MSVGQELEVKLPFDTYVSNERYKAGPESIKTYWEFHRRSLEDLEGYWASIARELEWFRPWDRVLDASNPPFFKWFVGGELNLSYLAVDRHVKTWRKNKLALIWEGEPVDQTGYPTDRRKFTYYDLWREVNRAACMLHCNFGIKKGDRVALYMPMVPEVLIAILAIWRIGAVHTTIFSGFSADALADRLADFKPRAVVTTDGFWRRGKVVRLKEIVDKALEKAPGAEAVFVVRRLGLNDVPMTEGRDWFWEDSLRGVRQNAYVEPLPVRSEDVSHILYTSGTTGKPKGIVHDTGGFAVSIYADMKQIFAVRDDEVYWCTGDIGWGTGAWYVAFGPFAMGLTQVMYEGAPDFPQPDRWWAIIERYGVNVFFSSPTAMRMFMRYGEEWPRKHDLSTLRAIFTVGEPQNPEAFWWMYRVLGNEKIFVGSTWGMTETGAVPLDIAPGFYLLPMKPGANGPPRPGYDIDVVDENGNPAPPDVRGYLVIRRPWPGMLHGIYGDPERYVKTYWSRFPGMFYAGDYAIKDRDGYIWVLGRADEVIKVAGHRLGTYELESALISHPAVAEAAVIGIPDPIKGEVPIAFVIPREGAKVGDELRKELRQHIRNTVGPIAEPGQIYFVTKLPKTRSGKIMRRVLRAITVGGQIGDVTTLEDETSVEEVKRAFEEMKKEIAGQETP
jgi:acetyl-CoA synthetase